MRSTALHAVLALAVVACADVQGRLTSMVDAVRSGVGESLAPDDPQLKRAAALAREQNWPGLREHCRAWVQQEPARPEAWAELGYAELALEHIDAGLAASQRAAALRPDYPAAWNNIGVALTRLGRIDEATAAFRKASLTPAEPR